MTGIRVPMLDGRVVTVSPSFACVWSAPRCVGKAAGLVAGPFKVEPTPRDEDDVFEWYEQWVADGEPE